MTEVFSDDELRYEVQQLTVELRAADAEIERLKKQNAALTEIIRHWDG